MDLDRHGQLLEKLTHRRRKAEKEREKRKFSYSIEDRNAERFDIFKKKDELQKEEMEKKYKHIKQKEAKTRKKLQQVEEKRITEIEVHREKQRLMEEEAKKRIEIKRRNFNFKKLQVLDKH